MLDALYENVYASISGLQQAACVSYAVLCACARPHCSTAQREPRTLISPTHPRLHTYVMCVAQVVPLSLISQWRGEIMRYTVPNTLSVCFYYGPDRETSASFLRWAKTPCLRSSFKAAEAYHRYI